MNKNFMISDDIVVRMIRDLVGCDYDAIHFYRDGVKYTGTSLVAVIDDCMFIDIRGEVFDDMCDLVYEAFSKYSYIFDNTYGVSLKRYKYVMICFYDGDINNLDSIVRMGVGNGFYDGFGIILLKRDSYWFRMVFGDSF